MRKMAKDMAIEGIAGLDDDPAMKLVAELKIVLLADYDAPGHVGLLEGSRAQAWRMVADLGKLLLERKGS
jgi:hypothetical protein